MLTSAIICAGKFFRAGNGAEMRRRFQVGQVLKSGKRNQVWVGRYWQPVLKDGRFGRERKAEILGTCDKMSKSKAQQALAEILRPINEGLHTPVCAMTFGDLWKRWQKEILCNYRPSTRGFYEDTATRWIVPYFEKWPLEDMTRFACQRYINQFGEYSKSVIKHVRATLSCILEAAVDWGWIEANPTLRLKLPKGKPVRQAPVLSPSQLATLLDSLSEPYRAMVVISGYTGVRESELMALRRDAVDRERQVIHIASGCYRGVLDETKNTGSVRDIPYGNTVAEALRRLDAATKKPVEYLFPSRKSGRMRWGDSINTKVFKPLACELGFPAFTWRSLRRSFSTTLNTAEVMPKTQQGLMGHVTLDMSLLYSEAVMSAKRSAMDRVEVMLSTAKPIAPKRQPMADASSGSAISPVLLDSNGLKSGLQAVQYPVSC